MRKAGTLAAALMGLTALLQVALAAGAPLGALAWGGGATVLPPGQRLASALAAPFLLFSAQVIGARAGLWRAYLRPNALRVLSWIFTFQLALNTVANAASPSPWERLIMTPVSLTLAICCLIVARGAPRFS